MPTRIIDGRRVQMPSFEFPPVEGETTAREMPTDNSGKLVDILMRARTDLTISRYDALREAFGQFTDINELRRHFSSTHVFAFMQATLGSPEDFRSALSEMPPEEVARKFDTPVVAELVQAYSLAGEGADD
jgi:hypothetical protein